MKRGLNRKGISPIIATVLILIITFVAVSILAVFVVPFVNQSLQGSEECFGVLGSVEFAESIYNCYTNGAIGGVGEPEDRTGFTIRVDGEEVAKLRIGLFSGGTSDVLEIDNNVEDGTALSPAIKMLNGQTTLTIPSKGGVRTYTAEGRFDKIEVGAVLNSGKVCDIGDTIELKQCVDNEAIDDLLAH